MQWCTCRCNCDVCIAFTKYVEKLPDQCQNTIASIREVFIALCGKSGHDVVGIRHCFDSQVYAVMITAKIKCNGNKLMDILKRLVPEAPLELIEILRSLVAYGIHLFDADQGLYHIVLTLLTMHIQIELRPFANRVCSYSKKICNKTVVIHSTPANIPDNLICQDL